MGPSVSSIVFVSLCLPVPYRGGYRQDDGVTGNHLCRRTNHCIPDTSPIMPAHGQGHGHSHSHNHSSRRMAAAQTCFAMTLPGACTPRLIGQAITTTM